MTEILSVEEDCGWCNGTGTRYRDKKGGDIHSPNGRGCSRSYEPITCSICNGTGRLTNYRVPEEGCEMCFGRGVMGINNYICPQCDGRGFKFSSSTYHRWQEPITRLLGAFPFPGPHNDYRLSDTGNLGRVISFAEEINNLPLIKTNVSSVKKVRVSAVLTDFIYMPDPGTILPVGDARCTNCIAEAIINSINLYYIDTD